jgi:NAD(P)-dependent dehydrogenase (short-subunit alcohol dehydrogenase family)
MSKTALVGLVRTLAVEWGPAGIRVNGIAPGYIATELTRPLQANSGFNQWVLSRTPAGRWGRPDDIAPAAVFLAGESAGFINGQVLYVDGGWTAAL